MNFPPQIYLLGAQKAGTTSLVSYLDSHPSLCVSEPKEPHYFTNNWANGEAWFRDRFSHAKSDNILIDASTSYTTARLGEESKIEKDNPYFNLAGRISLLSGSPKFIYMLRDPVKRTYSAYWHSVRAGEENRTFQHVVIDNLDHNNFYIRPSLYAEQLKLFLGIFPLEDFKLPLFESFIKNPSQEMAGICKFIGVDYVEQQDSGIKNASYNYSGAGKILQIDQVNKLAKTLGPYIPDAIKNAGKRTMTKPIPPIEDKDQEILQEYYKHHNKTLTELTNIDTSIWGY